VALAARRRGVDLTDEEALVRLCRGLRLEFLRNDGQERVLLDGEDVTEAIRTPENSMRTSQVSARPGVRRAMLTLQRQMGAGGGVVLEGRDIGTVVFPEAEVKIFLQADPVERARRRCAELQAKGLEVNLDQTVADVMARDAADSSREHAPLVQAEDAVAIDTTHLNIEQVLERILAVVQGQVERSGTALERTVP